MRRDELIKWMARIKKCSNISDAHADLEKNLRTLEARLAVESRLSSEFKTYVITRLKKLLRHHVTAVVRRTVDILINLTDECHSALPMEVIPDLMNEAASILAHEKNITGSGACIAEMLVYLVLNQVENQQFLQTSGCLHRILHLFSLMEFEDQCSIEYLNNMVNILVAACGFCNTNSANRETIAQVVIPKVVHHLGEWNSSATLHFCTALKDLLFLCRNVIGNTQICQNIFLSHGGLETALSVLKQTELMQEHMLIKISARKSVHIDISPTLFSSVVFLIDLSVTHNRKACQKAIELNTLNILQQFLSVAPVDHQVFIVPCIVHLLEAEIVQPDYHLLHKMFNIVNNLSGLGTMGVSTPVSKYIQERIVAAQSCVRKAAFRKGTPHPQKYITLKERGKSPRTLLPPLKCEEYQMSARTIQPIPPKKALLTSLNLKKRTSLFISTAELIVFMNCIKTHGVNMNKIRSVFPFHKNLTPGDLYALWRALWKKH